MRFTGREVSSPVSLEFLRHIAIQMNLPLVDQRGQPRSRALGQITDRLQVAVLHPDRMPVVGVLGLPLQVDLLARMYLGFVVLHPDDLGFDLAKERVSDFFFQFLIMVMLLE